MSPRQREYWSFYWPLTLMGTAVMVGRLAQNYVLLGYPEGVQELAVFALALAVYAPFQSGLAFVPYVANVLVRGPASLRASLRFLIGVCLALTLPVALLGWTPLGRAVLPLLYDVGPDRTARILLYLRYLTPLVLVFGLTNFLVGLLVQARMTGAVTALRVLEVALVVGVLAAGSSRGWDPVLTVSLSLILPPTVHLALACLLVALRVRRWPGREDRVPRRREMAAFLLPTIGTAMLFAATRPIIYALLTKVNPGREAGLPDVDAVVAGVSLAFSFGIVFQSAVNQLRHVFVTFGRQDPAGVRRFMVKVSVGVAALMLAIVASSAARWFFRELQDAAGQTLRVAAQAVLPLCLVPIAVGFRNYFHGHALVRKRTVAMVAGALMRNLWPLACGAALLAAGLLNHLTGASLLVLGFAAEGFTVMLLTRRLRREAE